MTVGTALVVAIATITGLPITAAVHMRARQINARPTFDPAVTVKSDAGHGRATHVHRLGEGAR